MRTGLGRIVRALPLTADHGTNRLEEPSGSAAEFPQSHNEQI